MSVCLPVKICNSAAALETTPDQHPDASVCCSLIINCNHHYLQRDQNNSSKAAEGKRTVT